MRGGLRSNRYRLLKDLFQCGCRLLRKMTGYRLDGAAKPPFGRIKIVDQGEYALLVDSTGYVQPTSYCEAVKTLKALGFERESTGVEHEKSFEIWRLPKERESSND